MEGIWRRRSAEETLSGKDFGEGSELLAKNFSKVYSGKEISLNIIAKRILRWKSERKLGLNHFGSDSQWSDCIWTHEICEFANTQINAACTDKCTRQQQISLIFISILIKLSLITMFTRFGRAIKQNAVL